MKNKSCIFLLIKTTNFCWPTATNSCGITLLFFPFLTDFQGENLQNNNSAITCIDKRICSGCFFQNIYYVCFYLFFIFISIVFCAYIINWRLLYLRIMVKSCNSLPFVLKSLVLSIDMIMQYIIILIVNIC